jgi:MoaA/NifB/PqqE/SkfB family radical SAM enzyme
VESITTVYFEGGEPFLFYPLLLEGVKIADEKGFQIGIVTNGFWGISEEDAVHWLKPFLPYRITDLSISDDQFHYNQDEPNHAKNAVAAMKKLNIPGDTICIETPTVKRRDQDKGEHVIGGGVTFKGRAVDTLLDNLPKRNWQGLIECPYEDLESPQRVHIDPYGNVHLCQGLVMGNIWEIPLSKLLQNYNPQSHPICKSLVNGGPAFLAKEYKIDHDSEYVDECHFCYTLRKGLIDKYPNHLAPRQVYGLS